MQTHSGEGMGVSSIIAAQHTAAGHGQISFVQLQRASSLDIVHLPQVCHLLVVRGVADAGTHLVSRRYQLKTNVRANIAGLKQRLIRQIQWVSRAGEQLRHCCTRPAVGQGARIARSWRFDTRDSRSRSRPLARQQGIPVALRTLCCSEYNAR